MNDVIVIMATMLISFLLGGIAILFFGGKMTLTYMMVKFSRGKKVLLMTKTVFGWRYFAAKKDQHNLLWNFDKKPIITDIKESGVNRFGGVPFVFVDSLHPTQVIEFKEGSMFPADFDPAVFNNILIRALTRPEGKIDKMLKQMIAICIVLSLISMIVGFVVMSKVSALAAGGVI